MSAAGDIGLKLNRFAASELFVASLQTFSVLSTSGLIVHVPHAAALRERHEVANLCGAIVVVLFCHLPTETPWSLGSCCCGAAGVIFSRCRPAAKEVGINPDFIE